MISRYGGIEILASVTEDEIVDSFLSIVRYRLKYFNLTVIGVNWLLGYDLWFQGWQPSMESSLTHYWNMYVRPYIYRLAGKAV